MKALPVDAGREDQRGGVLLPDSEFEIAAYSEMKRPAAVRTPGFYLNLEVLAP